MNPPFASLLILLCKSNITFLFDLENIKIIQIHTGIYLTEFGKLSFALLAVLGVPVFLIVRLGCLWHNPRVFLRDGMFMDVSASETCSAKQSWCAVVVISPKLLH